MARGGVLVALDTTDVAVAKGWARATQGAVAGIKLGLEFFNARGPAGVAEVASLGAPLFLDLKFHDIPNQVEQSVDAAVQTGAWMINVHASGGAPMMQAASRAGNEAAARLGRPRPVLIAVTVLTSIDQETLEQVGVGRPVINQVLALAQLTQQAGLDGVVASPQETSAIRLACGPSFTIVTPGIRGASAGEAKNDQARTMGPAEAVRAGASFIVVGRPIITAADPRAAADAIASELAGL
jgi:orotidine-5'-phosphate decarboxylase